VEVSTPEGTRISTPVRGQKGAAGTSTPSKLQTSSSRASYAAAVKAGPSDWHLEFSMGDQDIPLDTTVYGAVHQFEARSPGPRNMWANIYTVKFRKVSGPGPVLSEADEDSLVARRLTPPLGNTGRPTPEPASRTDSSNLAAGLPDSIPVGSPQGKILQLLRVLYTLNSDWSEIAGTEGAELRATPALPEAVFVNNKLTAKLNRQLEEPMIVASSCLPLWSLDLPQYFPFLFPFESRFSFLQSTSFGYARLIQKWVGQARNDNGSGRRDENLGFLGRLQRQKVRISRSRLLESAFKVFELYGSSRAMLEIEYFEEVGTGLGPTLEVGIFQF
jgi:E3 ubiquitin-protein ligase TRIP12